ncbi:MAG TPA: hypothetical protein VHE35_34480 [Kofleriaceae bacterium]|nr:hypothetical protein [Kofleriaceae bacterium]
MRLGSILSTIVFGAATCAFLSPASARPWRHDHAPRTGGTFGIGIGIGHISCEDSDGNDCGGGDLPAGGISLRAGSMLSPETSLSAELWGMTHREDGQTVTQGILAGVVRGWVAPILWLEGGVGVARTTSEYDIGVGTEVSQSDVVPAGVAGIGVEVLSAPDLAIDLELKGGAGLYEDDLRVFNASFGVGVSFY